MSNADDAEIIAAARVGFLDEAEDMLQQFESALLVMETTPGDAENLNAAFRAAHTIKGTAGLFGCDAVVSFTHEVETLMEALRSGRDRSQRPTIAAALLDGRDQMQALIGEVRSGASRPGRCRAQPHGSANACAPCAVRRSQATNRATVQSAIARTVTSAGAAGLWHLSLRFGIGRAAQRPGPARLHPLPRLDRRRCTPATPSPMRCRRWTQLDAESCHIGCELRLITEHGPGRHRRACSSSRSTTAQLAVLPPGAGPARFPWRCSSRTLRRRRRGPRRIAGESGWHRVQLTGLSAETRRRIAEPRPGDRQHRWSAAAVEPDRRQAAADRRTPARERRPEESPLHQGARRQARPADRPDRRARHRRLGRADGGQRRRFEPRSSKPRSASPSWCRARATAHWRCAWCRWARPSRASAAWCATSASSSARRSSSSSPAATPNSTSRWST